MFPEFLSNKVLFRRGVIRVWFKTTSPLLQSPTGSSFILTGNGVSLFKIIEIMTPSKYLNIQVSQLT